MFKKSAKVQSKNINVKNVKAVLSKCLSHRQANTKFLSRSMIQQQKQQHTLPIYTNILDQINHSHSQTTITPKYHLKPNTKNSSTQKHKLNIENEFNLQNFNKPFQKSGCQTTKRVSTQPIQKILNLSKMKSTQNKQTKFSQIFEQNRKLKMRNKLLEEENKQLRENLKNIEQREKLLQIKVKSDGQCKDHNIIIQSLKRVIDTQLQQIIQLERQIIVIGDKKQKNIQLIDQHTPSFPPSSPNKHFQPIESQNSTQEDINMYIDYVDTFRDKGDNQNIDSQIFDVKEIGQHNLTINLSSNYADQLLSEIDDCLDSLSRRRRQGI